MGPRVSHHQWSGSPVRQVGVELPNLWFRAARGNVARNSRFPGSATQVPKASVTAAPDKWPTPDPPPAGGQQGRGQVAALDPSHRQCYVATAGQGRDAQREGSRESTDGSASDQ